MNIKKYILRYLQCFKNNKNLQCYLVRAVLTKLDDVDRHEPDNGRGLPFGLYRNLSNTCYFRYNWFSHNMSLLIRGYLQWKIIICQISDQVIHNSEGILINVLHLVIPYDTWFKVDGTVWSIENWIPQGGNMALP